MDATKYLKLNVVALAQDLIDGGELKVKEMVQKSENQFDDLAFAAVWPKVEEYLMAKAQELQVKLDEKLQGM